jgi:hypothetical protein
MRILNWFANRIPEDDEFDWSDFNVAEDELPGESSPEPFDEKDIFVFNSF